MICIYLGNQAAKPVDLGVFLVQLWCNRHGKDGFCRLNGQSWVDPIERMDGIFPQIQGVQSFLPIRSQTLYPLSYGCVFRIIPSPGRKVNFRIINVLEIILGTTGLFIPVRYGCTAGDEESGPGVNLALLVPDSGYFQILTPPAHPTKFMLNRVLFSLEGHQDESPS